MADTGSLAEIRTRRRGLQDAEDAVSFVRRLAQGRLDLARDEQRRRADGGDRPSGTLAERLAEVFGQQHGGGSARPPRETNVPADHPLMQQLDELCEHYQFASLETLDDSSLGALTDGLEMFERECSRQRHELFEEIDALTAELVRRVREGGAGSVVSGE
ncbi:MAG: hypothetical protein ACKOQ1_04755 [Actinomycetota bacterium]